jgi:hypothetical protein
VTAAADHADGTAWCASRVADARVRGRLAVSGTVTALAVRHWGGGDRSLEADLDDGTGVVVVAFPGRVEVPGVTEGARVAVEGVLAVHVGRRVLWNPRCSVLG